MSRPSSNTAALRRLIEIEEEIGRIVAVFPELRDSETIPARMRLTRAHRRPTKRKGPPRHSSGLEGG